MSDKDLAVKKTWTVLVGINFYVKDKHLKGCVRDVGDIKQYLTARSKHVHVDTFTASVPLDSSSSHPAESPELWPTFKNLTTRLEEITAQANRGDIVYFHYAGHGTQVPSSSSKYNKTNKIDLALVLFDDIHGSRYLRGLELACMLDKMAKKGLHIRVVLDCCHSGSVTRSDDPNQPNIRGTDYDSAIDAAFPPFIDIDLGYQDGSSTLRDPRWQLKTLLNPAGYAVFTACGPHETAYELEQAGDRHEALSYFLLRALASLETGGSEVTNQSLHQQVRSRFHAYWPRQNPMLFGNNDISFWGTLVSAPRTYIPIFKKHPGNTLYLEAGLIHGVFKGDLYDAYSFGILADTTRKQEQIVAKVKVTNVLSLTSEVAEINSQSPTDRDTTGWVARPVMNFSPRKIYVRLMAHVDDTTLWMAAARRRRFLRFSTDEVEGEPSIFNVSRNDDDEYQILDTSYKRIICLPTVHVGSDESLNRVMDLLEHLATFKYIEGIENRNPTTTLQYSVTIETIGPDGEPLRLTDLQNVKNNDTLRLSIENTGETVIYVALCYLGPRWQVEILPLDSGEGDYQVVLPKDEKQGHSGRQEIAELKMTVSDFFIAQGQHHCKDILKLFITRKPISFSALVLPSISLGKSWEGASGPSRDRQSNLSNFLSEMAIPNRGTETGDRMEDGEWATSNFIIHTAIETTGVSTTDTNK